MLIQVYISAGSYFWSNVFLKPAQEELLNKKKKELLKSEVFFSKMGGSGLCISSPIRELFSTGTTKLAPHLTRHRNRALQPCIQMELYFSLEYWGKNGCY